MNYTELVNAVASYSENDNLSGIIDTLIDIAEARLYREIDFTHARKLAIANLTANDYLLQLPSDFWRARYLQVLNGTTRSFLVVKEPSFINEFWPDRTQTGFPRFFAFKKEDPLGGAQNHLSLAPTPDQAYAVELYYNCRPDKISSGNANTWLGTHAPDLLLASVMLEAQVHDKGELASLGNSVENPGWWQTHRKQAVERMIADQQAVLFDEYRGK
jgi:hypothetical protein